MTDSPRRHDSLIRKYIYSILIWIVFGLTVVPILLVLITIHFVSTKLTLFIYKEISHPLSAVSSFFGTQKDEKKCHVCVCFGLEGKLDVSDIRSKFESRVIHKENLSGKPQWPELQQFIVHKFGFPFWQWEKSFNIQNHIHAPIFDQKGLNPQEILDIVEAELLRKPFPPKQSPWEILVVSNFHDTPKFGREFEGTTPQTLLIFHFDHALGDGTAIFRFFDEFLKGGRNDPPSPPISRNVVWWEPIWDTIQLYFLGPYEFGSLGAEGQKFAWSPNKNIQRYNTAVSPLIPLGMIKKIRAANKASFSATMLGAMGNALGNFMKEAEYEVPEKANCALPRLADDHPVTKLTTHVTLGHAVVPLRRDPKQVEDIQNSLDRYTQSRAPAFYFCLIQLFRYMQSNLIEWLISTLPIDGEIIFANIQFPPDEPDGKETNKLRSIFVLGLPNMGGNGIVINSSGSKEGVRFVFQIDEGIVPKHKLHAEVLVNYFLQELELMSS